MAKILVVADDNTHTAEIVEDEDANATAVCSCRWTASVRGHFEDTVEAARIHVDMAGAR